MREVCVARSRRNYSPREQRVAWASECRPATLLCAESMYRHKKGKHVLSCLGVGEAVVFHLAVRHGLLRLCDVGVYLVGCPDDAARLHCVGITEVRDAGCFPADHAEQGRAFYVFSLLQAVTIGTLRIEDVAAVSSITCRVGACYRAEAHYQQQREGLIRQLELTHDVSLYGRPQEQEERVVVGRVAPAVIVIAARAIELVVPGVLRTYPHIGPRRTP